MSHRLSLIVAFTIILFSGVLIGPNGWAAAPQSGIQQGEKIFEDRKCSACHTVHGKGGKMGPDLSEIGDRRDEVFFKKFLPNPKSVFPQTIMPPFQGAKEELDALAAYLQSLKKGSTGGK